MNFALSDEQVLLREAARGALSRFKTIEAARDALENEHALPDLWPTAVEAGWPGLLIDEEHGGAGLGGFDALLVAEECGRVLASIPVLGLLPATAILNAAGDESLSAVAAGELRPAYVPARPPSELESGWTVEPRSGVRRAEAPRATVDGDAVVLDGTVAFVPDAPRRRPVRRDRRDGRRRAGGGRGAGRCRRRLGRVGHALRRDPGARARQLRPGARVGGSRRTPRVLADAWYLAHALIAAESLGSVQTCLEMSVAYAKERFTFGRAIGSYQAIKHELTEILRLQENSRGLQYYAGWARDAKPEEFPLAASAARAEAGHALDYAARAMINVHGGIGATWEHDAPLFFRRAQLSRRLLGGTHDAVDRVAEQTLLANAA